MTTLATQIPARLTETKISDQQRAGDIVRLLLLCEKQAQDYYPVLAKRFKKPSKLETCREIWDWMKDNIQYRKEPAVKQTGKTIGRILNDKYGDCKAFATFAVAACRACGIPCCFRLASYRWEDKTPTHIYCVAYVKGQEIVIDGVLNKFNQEAPYKYTYNVKPLN